MMSCLSVNKKGFINAFSLFLIQFIAMLSLLYTTRYQTLLAQQQRIQQGYMCELYILHHITKQTDIHHEGTPSEDTSQEIEEMLTEEDEITQDDKDDMPMEEEFLSFKNCDILLEYQNNDVVASYSIDEQTTILHITLDGTTKEIMDIAYEKGYLPQ